MRTNTAEKGQAIVVIVVSVFAMVAMAALIIDGGNLFMNRRAAQTAADAAALAGAYEYCVHEVAYPIDKVTEYATVMNDATAVEDLTVTSDQLEVTVRITKPTFFAKIFGQSTGTVLAKAAANCFNPDGVSDIIPIAWSCRPPEGADPADDCVLQKLPYDVYLDLEKDSFDFKRFLLDEPLNNEDNYLDYQTDTEGALGEGKLIYVVMDTDNFDEAQDCVEAGNGGTINCDFNGDGTYEVAGSANRGWLYLEDKPGTDLLAEVMKNGPSSDVHTDTWFAGKPGVSAKVFQHAAEVREGEIALVPVFDALCEDINAKGGDFENDCTPYDASIEDYVPIDGSASYYRIVAFAPFYVSCVADQQKDICPGRTFAGLDKGGNKSLTIEGYFIDKYVITASPGGSFDTGLYVISLTE